MIKFLLGIIIGYTLWGAIPINHNYCAPYEPVEVQLPTYTGDPSLLEHEQAEGELK